MNKRLALFLFVSAFVPIAAFAGGRCAACSFGALLPSYEAGRQALADGVLNQATEAGRQLAVAAAAEWKYVETDAKRKEKETTLWQAILRDSGRLQQARSLPAARQAYGDLSAEIVTLRAFAERDDVTVYYCPKLKKRWLQQKGPPQNPYGSASPDCARDVTADSR